MSHLLGHQQCDRPIGHYCHDDHCDTQSSWMGFLGLVVGVVIGLVLR